MENDDFAGCSLCDGNHETRVCPMLKKNKWCHDQEVSPRAYQTLPINLEVIIIAGGVGVFAKSSIPVGTQFGPFEAPYLHDSEALPDHPFKIFRKNSSSPYLDTSDQRQCNWMCLVAFSESLIESNILVYQLNAKLYFTARRHITVGTELKVAYAAPYGRKIARALKDEHRITKEQLTTDSEPEPREINGITTGNIPVPRRRTRGDYAKQSHIGHNKMTSKNSRKPAKLNDSSISSKPVANRKKQPTEPQIALDTLVTISDNSDAQSSLSAQLAMTPESLDPCELSSPVALCDPESDSPGEIVQAKETSGKKKKPNDAPSLNVEIVHLGEAEAAIKNNAKAKTLEDGELVIDGDESDSSYICAVCNKVYAKKNSLYSHMKQHTDDYYCSDCCKYFTRRDTLISHICYTECPELECAFCGKKFERQHFLKRHLMRHFQKFRCHVCQKLYTSKKCLLNHKCVDEILEERFVCDDCGRNFASEEDVSKHSLLHSGHFICPLCGMWVEFFEIYSNHVKLCQKVKDYQENEGVKCKDCSINFLIIGDYRKHEYEHKFPNKCGICGERYLEKDYLTKKAHVCKDLTFFCEICEEKFDHSFALLEHRPMHGAAQFKCPACRMEFHKQVELDRHCCSLLAEDYLTRKALAERCLDTDRVACEICGAFFNSIQSLRSHGALHSKKKYSCKYCEKGFHRKAGLHEHELSHTGVHEFECDVCHKMFKTKKILLVHSKIHSEKGYICATCGKGFHQKTNLLKHEECHKTVEDRSLVCEYCNKVFVSVDYFRMHKASHQQGKRFMCEFCPNAYMRRHQLVRHQKKHYQSSAFTCSYCGLVCKYLHLLRQHLRGKHKAKESEWSARGFMKSMKKKLMERKSPVLLDDDDPENDRALHHNSSFGSGEAGAKVTVVTQKELNRTLAQVTNNKQKRKKRVKKLNNAKEPKLQNVIEASSSSVIEMIEIENNLNQEISLEHLNGNKPQNDVIEEEVTMNSIVAFSEASIDVMESLTLNTSEIQVTEAVTDVLEENVVYNDLIYEEEKSILTADQIEKLQNNQYVMEGDNIILEDGTVLQQAASQPDSDAIYYVITRNTR